MKRQSLTVEGFNRLLCLLHEQRIELAIGSDGESITLEGPPGSLQTSVLRGVRLYKTWLLAMLETETI